MFSSFQDPADGIGGMKRRLPNTRHGGSVLDLINIPPVTNDTNAHTPGVNTSWRTIAALCAQMIATIVAATTDAGQRGATSPPSSTVNAAKPDNITAERSRNRRTHPRAVEYGTAASAATGPNVRPDATAASTPPIVSTMFKRPTSRNDGTSACDTAHDEHRARTSHTRKSRIPTRTVRSYPDQNPITTRHDGHDTRGATTPRPAAAYTSTETGHGHTMAMGEYAPFRTPPRRASTRRTGRGPSRSGTRHPHPATTPSPNSPAETVARVPTETGRQHHAFVTEPGWHTYDMLLTPNTPDPVLAQGFAGSVVGVRVILTGPGHYDVDWIRIGAGPADAGTGVDGLPTLEEIVGGAPPFPLPTDKLDYATYAGDAWDWNGRGDASPIDVTGAQTLNGKFQACEG